MTDATKATAGKPRNPHTARQDAETWRVLYEKRDAEVKRLRAALDKASDMSSDACVTIFIDEVLNGQRNKDH